MGLRTDWRVKAEAGEAADPVGQAFKGFAHLAPHKPAKYQQQKRYGAGDRGLAGKGGPDIGQ